MDPKATFILCFTVRTGSSLLCEYLTAAGLGSPGEFFQGDGLIPAATLAQRPTLQFTAYFAELLGTRTLNGVFGFKVDWFGFERLRTRLASEFEVAPDDSIERLLNDPALVYVYRRDKIRQAISAWKAASTGRWHLHRDSQNPSDPDYSFEQIYGYLRRICSEEQLWNGYFASRYLVPVRICYEDLISDPGASVSRIAECTGRRFDREVLKNWTPIGFRMANNHSDLCYSRFCSDLFALQEKYDERDFQFRYVQSRLLQFRSERGGGVEKRFLDLFGPDVVASEATIVVGEHFDRGRAWYCRPGGRIQIRTKSDVVRLVFLKHAWSGFVRIDGQAFSRTVDLYSELPVALEITLPSAGMPVAITALEKSNSNALGHEVWLQDAYNLLIPVNAAPADVLVGAC